MSTGRLEAFSDGVIAVIITILVLELKVPVGDGLAGLHEAWPTLFLYLLTFVQTGIYWVNHHYLTDEAESVTHAMLWANLAFLFCLSLFPFATEWVGAKHVSSSSVAVYSVVSLLPGVAYSLLAAQVKKQITRELRDTRVRQAISITVYTLAIPAAYIRPGLSLLLLCLVATMWVFPPRQIAASDTASGATGAQTR